MEFKNTKINLFGTVYKIKFVDRLIKDDEGGFLWGVIYHDKCEILISTKTNDGRIRSNDEILTTLFHELIHAFLACGAYHKECDDEPLVEWLAKCALTVTKQLKI